MPQLPFIQTAISPPSHPFSHAFSRLLAPSHAFPQLPFIQTVAQRVITIVVLLGFVLVDLGAPKLEATLFAVTSSCFVLINIFLDDLSDPFSGTWNVDAARDELQALVQALQLGASDAEATRPRADLWADGAELEREYERVLEEGVEP